MRKKTSSLKYLSFGKSTSFLTCPRCFVVPESSLQYKSGFLVCKSCKQKYPIKKRVLQLIYPGALSRQVRSELIGNEIPLTRKNIERFATKDKWSKYYNHFVDQKINYLMEGLGHRNFRGIISLGSGPGFEIKEILKKRHFPLVFSSDLASSATSIVPYTLSNANTTVCLFTSDLNYVPIIPNKSYPILIYEALHHTKSSLKTLEGMMQKKYFDIFFVEPCTNFFIRFLAKLGLAQRVEYSGVHPDFIDLVRVGELAKKYKYKLHLNTIWDIPEEYIRRICKEGSWVESVLLIIIDLSSKVGNLLNWGSFAIVHLQINETRSGYRIYSPRK